MSIYSAETMMKRNREADDNNSITIMANYLMLLSGTSGGGGGRGGGPDSSSNRVFTCKTCERQFTSFQALGGHRASHKKPRLMMAGEDHPFQTPLSPPKPKIHECSICGLEFPIGQALGGHMRRHRATNNVGHHKIKQLSQTFLSLSSPEVPIVKKLPKNRRVLCLDLNLTPLENKFIFGKVHVPDVDFI